MVRRNNASHLVLKNQMLEKKQDKNKIVFYIQITALLLLAARFLIYIYHLGEFNFLGVSNRIISYDETIELYQTIVLVFISLIAYVILYVLYFPINLIFNKWRNKKSLNVVTAVLLFAICFFNNYFYTESDSILRACVITIVYILIISIWISAMYLFKLFVQKRKGTIHKYIIVSILYSMLLSTFYTFYLLINIKFDFFELKNITGSYDIVLIIFLIVPLIYLLIESIKIESFIADIREIKKLCKFSQNSMKAIIGTILSFCVLAIISIGFDYYLSKSNIENDKNLAYISNIELNEINTFTNKVEKEDMMICVLLEGNTEYLLAPCISEGDELIIMKDDIFPYSKEGLTIKKAYLKKHKVFREESILKNK